MTLSQELKEVYASVGPSIVLETLELNHHTFPETFRIVRDNNPWDLGIENGGPVVTFSPHAFNVVPPKKSDKGAQSLQIQIDNVDRTVVDLIEGTQDGTNTPIDVVYRIFLSTATSEPQDAPLRLSLFNVSITNNQVSGTARRDDIVNRKFPRVVYDRKFISLFSGR